MNCNSDCEPGPITHQRVVTNSRGQVRKTVCKAFPQPWRLFVDWFWNSMFSNRTWMQWSGVHLKRLSRAVSLVNWAKYFSPMEDSPDTLDFPWLSFVQCNRILQSAWTGRCWTWVWPALTMTSCWAGSRLSLQMWRWGGWHCSMRSSTAMSAPTSGKWWVSSKFFF